MRGILIVSGMRILIFFLWDMPVMVFKIWRDARRWEKEMRKVFGNKGRS